MNPSHISPSACNICSANGSILFELNITEHRQSNGLQQCGSLMPTIINLVHALGCPSATNADVVQVRWWRCVRLHASASLPESRLSERG